VAKKLPRTTWQRPLWSVLANHRLSSMRVSNGKLFVTSDRLVFCPHRLDSAVFGGSWSVKRTDIRSVSVEPPGTTSILGLSVRSLVDIEISSDSMEQFLVFSPQMTIQRLKQELFS